MPSPIVSLNTLVFITTLHAAEKFSTPSVDTPSSHSLQYQVVLNAIAETAQSTNHIPARQSLALTITNDPN